ncbi:MAG TPA: phosphoenolpyruvate--protein phosphotransferase [Kofleriaceae bacterium]|nr:phosphoenolpyruvate--protein phosphotransferase [Kofleriaceae bacterium]
MAPRSGGTGGGAGVRDEIRREGIPVSPGIAIGRAYMVDRRRLKTPKYHLDSPEAIEDEITRLHRALQASYRELERIKQKIEERTETEHYNIIEAHQLILRDEHLVDETVRYIREEKINAEWALQMTVEHIKGVFDAIEDDYFRERRSDVDFVGERVLRNLLGREAAPVAPPPDAVVVAHDLSPADTAQLHRMAVAGLVTDAGGKTSHTAIIARAHEIPAVVGLEDITQLVGSGDLIIVDGTQGIVIVNPTAETVSEHREQARHFAAHEAALLRDRDLPAVTTDGHALSLVANVDTANEIESAVEHGAAGIGLFRTEYLFMMGDSIPTEQDHYESTRAVLEGLGGLPATFRTFDLGADKLYSFVGENMREANPALGLRSMRLCLQDTVLPIFKQQLRGLLRASVHGKCRIMFPMISGMLELRMARQVLDDTMRELRDEGVPFDDKVKVGIMIEMPSAAIIADVLAREVDFFSIGTNDLIQYTLAVDRVNEHVTYLYEPLHPSLLRLLDGVVRAGAAAGVPVSVCGEMAGDPTVVPVLIGLGLEELSMSSVAIPEIKALVRRMSLSGTRELVARAMKLGTAGEIAALVADYLESLT